MGWGVPGAAGFTPWWPPYSMPVRGQMPNGSRLTPFPAPTSVTAVKLPDGVTFIVYEFWETEEDWKR